MPTTLSSDDRGGKGKCRPLSPPPPLLPALTLLRLSFFLSFLFIFFFLYIRATPRSNNHYLHFMVILQAAACAFSTIAVMPLLSRSRSRSCAARADAAQRNARRARFSF